MRISYRKLLILASWFEEGRACARLLYGRHGIEARTFPSPRMFLIKPDYRDLQGDIEHTILVHLARRGFALTIHS